MDKRKVQQNHGTGKPVSMPSLLVRHRWLGFLEGGYWLCHPSACSLRENNWDPVCHGCKAVIAFTDLPNIERYRGDHMVESLALRLDMLHEELKISAKEPPDAA